MPEVEHETEMDPLSAAAAAKAVTTTANAAAKNSLVQALFLPTAKAYGDHWGAETRERLKAASARKKQDNVTAHLKAVRPHVPADFRPDPELTDAWMSGAEEIDPVDEELSAAWRATLLAIGAGDPYRKRMLDVVKAMSPDEARAFIAIARRAPGRSLLAELTRGYSRYQPPTLNDYRNRLETLGLVRSRWEMLSSPSSGLAFLLGGAMVLTVLGARTVNFLPSSRMPSMSLEVIDAMVPLTLCMAVILALLTLVRAMTAVSLTGFGSALASAVGRLAAHEAAPADRSDDVEAPRAPEEQTAPAKVRKAAKPKRASRPKGEATT